MDCERVRRLLNAYIDGELDLVTSLDIEAHLQSCAACSTERQSLETLHHMVSDRALYHTAPVQLERRIQASIKKAERDAAPRPVFAWQWFAPAAALLLIVVFLAGYFGRGLLAPNPDTALAQAVQNAHVRSLMANHLMDVPSTDQHTVKPWFDGKLDFSPPVINLAAQGFPLIGGRLDYIQGRSVAALVYQRNKHTINLFIWPDNGQPAGSEPTPVTSATINGYTVLHWTQSGMTFWAVSDVSSSDLAAFVRAFQASAATPDRTPESP